MSDPVTNVEIEDVLSSIRKLVAEDVRATPVMRKPERPGRLILTAAQRVRDETPEPDQTREPVLLTQPILPEDTPPAELAIEDIPGDARLSDFGEVEGAFPDIDEIEREETGGDMPDMSDAASETEAQADASETWDDETEATGSIVQDEARSELHRLIEEEVSAALAGEPDRDRAASDDADDEVWDVPASDDDWTADQWDADDDSKPGADPAPVDGANADSLDEVFDAADDLFETAADTDPVDTQEHVAESDETPVPTPLLTLEDKVAALGRLVARDNHEFEEERDRPDADELAAISEPMTWPEAPYEDVEDLPDQEGSNVLHAQDVWPQTQASSETEPEPAVPHSAELQTLPASDPSAIEIDEDTLRQMVVDIVRQELQGALGERITRNVRKLVRREIHRMLISQDFD